MINLKVLSTAAVMALVLSVVVPSQSSAQVPGVRAGGAPGGGGGGGMRPGGGGGGAAIAPGGGGGGFRAGGGGGRSFATGGGSGFRPGVAAPSMGGRPVPGISGGAVVARGGNYGGARHYGGGYHRHRGGSFWPGVAIGAGIGSAYGYYGSSYYGSSPDYYDDGYYDEGVVAASPAPAGDDSVAYCMQTYKSYDPNSGTYLGYDGQRHPCP